MGIVRMGVPEELALFIKDSFQINSFIETGTFLGGTAEWAAQHFDKVYTIEFSKELFERTRDKYAQLNNIIFYHGDSRIELEKILKNANTSIIWLDAHWCGDESYGEEDQCPLLQELDLLMKDGHPHFILIDDARLFMVPPPLPNKVSHYPDIQSIAIKLNAKGWKMYIHEDVIACIPSVAIEIMNGYFQNRTTKDWDNHVRKLIAEKQTSQEKLNSDRFPVVKKIKRFFQS